MSLEYFAKGIVDVCVYSTVVFVPSFIYNLTHKDNSCLTLGKMYLFTSACILASIRLYMNEFMTHFVLYQTGLCSMLSGVAAISLVESIYLSQIPNKEEDTTTNMTIKEYMVDFIYKCAKLLLTR